MQLKQMRSLSQDIVNEYKQRRDILAVLLFGSVTSGNIHPNSDLDIVVVLMSESSRIER